MIETLSIVLLVLLLAVIAAAVVFYVKLAAANRDKVHAETEKSDLTEQLGESAQQVDSYRAEIEQFKNDIASNKQQVALSVQNEQHLKEQIETLQEMTSEKLQEKDSEHAKRLQEKEAEFVKLVTEKQEAAKKQEQLLREEFAKREAALKQQFEELQSKSTELFESIAGKTLKKTNEQFLQLATEKFKGEKKDAKAQLDKRTEAIKNMVDPIKEKLKVYDETIHALERARKQSYGELSATVKKMIDDQRMLKDETQKLVTALKRPEVRGQWGEMHLEKLLEMAGFREGLNYDKQVSKDGGRLRPDTVVHLTSDRDIVIDVKTPLDAYLSAIEAVSKADQDLHLKRHTKNILTQVDSLYRKDYKSQFDRTPEFVVMFIPAESFLQPAVQERPTLLEDAFNKGIVIATPSTLIALLKTVAVGWREEALAENARKISDAGKELHKRISTCTGHLEKLGKAVGNTVTHFNKFVGSFETKVMVQARRFEELEAADPKKQLVQIEPIEVQPREVKVIDSTVTDHMPASTVSEEKQQLNMLEQPSEDVSE
ncbi:DNA recombination protein RmuC [Planctomycetota bacterium]|nr:DNA recombination protein RmuC [Planctomycetota bacterium]